jgi:FkbM family methyltransferase
VRRVLSPLGFELVRLRRPETQLLTHLLKAESISIVLDIGANQGQYAMRMRSLGYQGVIHSYEPGVEAFRDVQRFSSGDPLWNVHQLALSDSEGTQILYVSEDSVSSSLLPVADAHLRAAPASRAVHTEGVRTARLDDVLQAADGDRIWLKLDTQGSEDRVLAGAPLSLLQTRVVQTELSLLPCYDGQADYRQVIDHLHRLGFRLVAVEPGTQDPFTGQMLQFDGIFTREI